MNKKNETGVEGIEIEGRPKHFAMICEAWASLMGLMP